MRLAITSALACAAVLAAAPARAQTEAAGSDTQTVAYTVKQGDTLIDLAAAYFMKRSDYEEVQRLNQVADPRRLPVGMELRLPANLLRTVSAEAEIAGLRGEVTLEHGGRRAAPEVGEPLGEGAVLATGPNSFVRIALLDGSFITIPSNSRVRLSRLRRFVLTGTVDHEIVVEKGRAESDVAPRQSPGNFRVRTPVSVSAVRGTEFRVSLAEDVARAATEVLEGQVGVTPQSGGAEVIAAASQGVSVTPDAARIAALLEPPSLANPGAVQTGAQISFEVAPLDGASRYRGRVATDAGMIDAVAEADTAGGQTTLLLPELSDGAYFLRLSAISLEGVEGLHTVYSFVRAHNELGGLGAGGQGSGWRSRYLFRWESQGEGDAIYRFQLFGETPGAPPLIDETGLDQTTITVSGLAPGVYRWRVRATRQLVEQTVDSWSEPQELRIAR